MTWKEFVQEQMGEAEKLIDSGYKPETGELIFFPVECDGEHVGRHRGCGRKYQRKNGYRQNGNRKVGGTFEFSDMEDLKDLLEYLKKWKVRGILIDFEKCVITVMDTMEEEPKHEPGTAEAAGPRSEKETSGEA